MLRRLLGLCLALTIVLAAFPAPLAFSTSAQDGSPVAVDPDPVDTSDGAPSVEDNDSGQAVFPADEPGNTPGDRSNFELGLPGGVTVIFGNTLQGGNTTAFDLDPSDIPPLPDGYRSDNARVVSIETTATFQYRNLVCLLYDATNISDPSTMALFVFSDSAWVDITDPGHTFVISATVCGYTDGLGIFAAAERGVSPTAIPSDTPVPSPTETASPTATATQTFTPSPTETLPPTRTPTWTATATETATPSETATWTATVTATATPSATWTATSSSTASSTSSPTSTATSSVTPSPTATASATPSATTTASPSATFTATPTSATGQTQFALPNVWVIFARPPDSGITTGSVIDGGTLPALPGRYRATTAWFFSISSTVTLDGNKQLCVLFRADTLADPSTATLLGRSGSTWTPLSGQWFTDLTSEQGTRCGYITTFGEFALAELLPATATATTTPSRTPVPSLTPSPTASITPSPTSTFTVTPSRTASPSSTSTTPPTVTPSSTWTNSPTATPSFTSTPVIAPGSYPTGTQLRATTRVNLRTGPGTTSASLGIVESGAVVSVTGSSISSGGRFWVPVSTSTLGAGWIAGDYLAVVPLPTPTRTAAPATATRTPGASTPTRTATRVPGGFIVGDTIRTTTSVNLRSDATTSSHVLSVIPGKTIGTITGSGISSGGFVFYPVTFAGRPGGFVAGKYLERLTAVPTATRTPSPTATVAGNPLRWTTGNVNMRSGPGTGYKVIAKFPKDTRVSVIGSPRRSGGYDWYPVAVYGYGTGWIAGKFLTTKQPI